MNAVDAVERLAALGRRVQAREQHLQRPVAPLHVSPLWEQAPADPLSALGALLAAAGNAPPPRAAAAGPHVSRPSAHSPASFSAPPPAEEQRGNDPFAPLRDSSPPLEAGRPDGRGPDTHPATGQTPVSGVRLVRRQAALLGILGANTDANRQGAAESTPHEGVRAAQSGQATQSGEAAQGGRDAQLGRAAQSGDSHAQSNGGEGLRRDMDDQAGWEDARRTALDGPARLSVSPPGVLESLALDATGDDSVRGSRLPDHFSAAEQSVAPMTVALQAARDQDGSMDAGMDMDAQAAEAEFLAETWPLGPSNPTPHSPSTKMRWDGQSPLPVDSPWDDGVWRSPPDGVRTERPLSLAQIDQVLAALDERLELLLLRTYGTSGST